MNNESFEDFLRRSDMEYPEKATWLLRGVKSARTICPDCPSPPTFVSEKTRVCCGSCPFLMMIWIFNEKQMKIWDELRPPDIKRKEVEKAVNEQKISQIEQTMGRVCKLTSLPLFLKNKNMCPVRSLCHKNFLRKFLCIILTG